MGAGRGRPRGGHVPLGVAARAKKNPGRSDPGFRCRHWLRGTDSNRRPSGYEPDELPLLHPATAHGSDRSRPGQTAFRSRIRLQTSGTKVPSRLVSMTGLLRRTARRTVPDMFRRHHTDPDRETASVISAFHDRLASSLVTTRTDPPRVSPYNL